jgi:hypothetical protein
MLLWPGLENMDGLCDEKILSSKDKSFIEEFHATVHFLFNISKWKTKVPG